MMSTRPKVVVLSTLAAIAMVAARIDEEPALASRAPEPPPPPPPERRELNDLTPGSVRVQIAPPVFPGSPNLAADFARYQARERDRQRMESAKAKRQRKLAKRLSDAAKRAR